jgi:hypothetical protein
VNLNTLAAIRRTVAPGQRYELTNHRADPFHGPVRVIVTQTYDTRFYVEHTLGEARIGWPPARFVRRDEDGTLYLARTDGQPFLTLRRLAGDQ